MWSPGDGQACSLHGLGTTNAPPFTRTCPILAFCFLAKGFQKQRSRSFSSRFLSLQSRYTGSRGWKGRCSPTVFQAEKGTRSRTLGEGGDGGSGLLPLTPFGRCPHFEGGGRGGGGEGPGRPLLGAFGAWASVRLTLWIPAGATPKQRRCPQKKAAQSALRGPCRAAEKPGNAEGPPVASLAPSGPEGNNLPPPASPPAASAQDWAGRGPLSGGSASSGGAKPDAAREGKAPTGSGASPSGIPRSRPSPASRTAASSLPASRDWTRGDRGCPAHQGEGGGLPSQSGPLSRGLPNAALSSRDGRRRDPTAREPPTPVRQSWAA